MYRPAAAEALAVAPGAAPRGEYVEGRSSQSNHQLYRAVPLSTARLTPAA
ncbi:hypothetical protein [Kitasatospora purpeofusca]